MADKNNNKHTMKDRETEAWFKDLVDHARDLVQCVNSEGRFIYVNKAWLSTLKYSPEEIAEITLWDIIHPDSMEHCMAVFNHVLTGKPFGEVEAIFTAKDGTPVMVEGNVSVKLDEKDHFLHTRGIFRDVTERKRVDEALRESEERNRAILSAFPDLMFVYNREGVYLDFHASDKSNLAAEPGNFLNKPVHEVLPKEVADIFIDGFKEAYQSGKTQKVEYQLETLGGHKHFEARVNPLDQDKYIAIVRDITDRKKAEEALKLSEARLDLAMAVKNEGIWDVNLNTNETYYDDRYYMMAGYQPGEFTQDSAEWEKRVHEEDLPFVQKAIADHLNGTSAKIDVEYRFKKKDGQWMWVSDKGKVYERDASGKPVRIVGTHTDITERKQAEKALKASEQKHREILEAMEEGYYEVDLAGNLVFFNESFRRMTGYSCDELMGESYKQFYKNTQEVFKTYNQVYKTGRPVTVADWPAVDKEGREAYMELSVALRRDESGKPIGFRGVVRDITERKQAEEKIRYLSFHDKLTGLYNRTFLEEEMKRLNTKRQLPVAVIMADLNGLKLVNDTYGHKKGDEMLIAAAKVIKSSCREEDIISRWGGDEFVILLPQTTSDETTLIGKRITEGCRNSYVEDVPLSIALGMATKEDKAKDLMDTLREAEDEMYKRKLTESRSTKSAIVTSLLNTLAEKSYETEKHTREMQTVAQKIGVKINLPESELHRLELLITLHDIGKINISEEILTKEGPLTDVEWKAIVRHPEIGSRIAMATEEFAHVADDILAHHERWDGSGYPQGLKGEAIPLLARITAIADAFEVMSNGRPYKKAISRSEIVAEFKNCSGTHFDPKLVEIFLLILEEVC